MICYKCGNDIPSDSEYCPFCGIKLFVTCPKCGHTHSSQYPICNKCGTNRVNYIAEQQRLKEEELRSEKQRIEERKRIEEKQKRIAAERLAKERAIQEEKARERTILSNWSNLTGSDTGNQILTYNHIFKYREFGNHVFGNDVLPSNIIVPSGVKTIYGFTSLVQDIRWVCGHHKDIIEGPKSADWRNEEELLNARQRVFSALHSLEIQDGVERIGGYGAFMDCDSLSILSLPNSLKTIGVAAFSGCYSLNKITIPDSVKGIGGGAFSGCSPSAYFVSNKYCPLGERFLIAGNVLLSVALNGVDIITIPNTIESIGMYAFRGCKTLKHVIIPKSVSMIGLGAFYGCSSLQSIEIPDSVTTIRGSAFDYCNNLTSITVSKNNPKYKSINNCILTKDGKKLISCRSHNIPDGVTMIGDSAFCGCTSLQSIVIPDSVTTIGDSAFEGCTSLQSIVIPESVTEISWRAFARCISLQSIEIHNSETKIEDSAFEGCTTLKSIVRVR